jgi:tetratricopeptide (TPR) repeat protein
MKIHRAFCSSILVMLSCVFLMSQTTTQTPPAPASEAANLIKQARQLNSDGKQDEAIALYEKAIKTASGKDLYDAHLGEGIALDLKGQYDEARKHLAKAIEIAPADSKIQALKAMAFSYAFQRNAKEAAKFENQAFDMQIAAQKFVDAAGTANELARIQLESGDIADAAKTYKTGYDTALKATLTPAERDLWDFRWEHAQARIAARKSQLVNSLSAHRGLMDEAQKHVAAAKAILDKGTNPNQAIFFPYLTGYVAFYTGDYKTAIADLQKADQKDPFILALIAQAYEKSGDQSQAMDYYRKVLAINSHNPTNAFARPLAQKMAIRTDPSTRA